MSVLRKKGANLPNVRAADVGAEDISSTNNPSPSNKHSKKLKSHKSHFAIISAIFIFVFLGSAATTYFVVKDNDRKEITEQTEKLQKDIDNAFKAGNKDEVVAKYNELYEKQSGPAEKAESARSLTTYYYPGDLDKTIEWSDKAVEMYTEAGDTKKANDMKDFAARVRAYKEQLNKESTEKNDGRDSQL